MCCRIAISGYDSVEDGDDFGEFQDSGLLVSDVPFNGCETLLLTSGAGDHGLRTTSHCSSSDTNSDAFGSISLIEYRYSVVQHEDMPA